MKYTYKYLIFVKYHWIWIYIKFAPQVLEEARGGVVVLLAWNPTLWVQILGHALFYIFQIWTEMQREVRNWSGKHVVGTESREEGRPERATRQQNEWDNDTCSEGSSFNIFEFKISREKSYKSNIWCQLVFLHLHQGERLFKQNNFYRNNLINIKIIKKYVIYLIYI